MTKATPERGDLIIPGLESVLGLQLPPSLQFDGPGVTHTLTVTGARPVRDRDFKTGKELDWPSGDPKMILVLIGEDDNGRPASHWVRGRRANDAFRGALVQQGASGVAIGDVWTITRGQDEELPPQKGEKEPSYANTWEMSVAPAGVK